MRQEHDFNNTFFPCCSQEWNNLSDDIKSLPSPVSFKKALLSFVKTSKNSVFAIHNKNGIKLLTCLRLNFSHLNEHKFRHNFLDTINSICSCGSEPETAAHFLLRCQNYAISRSKLLKIVYNIDQTLQSRSNFDQCHLFHNKEIIKLTVCYLKDTKRFDENLIWNIYILLIIIIILHHDIDF